MLDCQYLVKGNRGNTLLPTWYVSYWLSNGVFTFDFGSFWRSKSNSCKFLLWLSHKRRKIANILLFSIDGVLICFRWVYLALNFSRFKGEGHTNFNSEYLVNGDRSSTLPIHRKAVNGFEWCIYIWPWHFHKVNVKIMQILTVNIS